jgi:hypothetical protein
MQIGLAFYLVVLHALTGQTAVKTTKITICRSGDRAALRLQ